MNVRHFYIFIAFFLFAACNDDTERRQLENERDLKKQAAVFATIDKAWHFNTNPQNAAASSLAVSWNEWRVLLSELAQKPQSSIGAFRKKARTLSIKAKDLNNRIPAQYDKPEIKSRISVLITKINSLNLYVNLYDIPDKKVVTLIGEINTELGSIQQQMDEVVRKSQIPKEEGEADMLRMLDTARAIPNKPVKQEINATRDPRAKVKERLKRNLQPVNK